MSTCIFSHREMALLWAVNLCAISASTLTYIYLSYYVYLQTANLIFSQLILFAPMILPVILVAWIYRLSDWLPPRTLLWTTNLMSLISAWITYQMLPHYIGVAVGGAIIIGTLDALQRVGRIVAIKCYFPGSQIASSVPLTLTAQFIAGGLAGLSMMLLKADMTPDLALKITGILFATAMLAAIMLPASIQSEGAVRATPKLIRALAVTLNDYPPVRLTLLRFLLFVSLFQGFFNVSRVLLPAHVLGLGEAYVGLLQAVNSIAALVGAVLFYQMNKRGFRLLQLPMPIISSLFMIISARAINLETSYAAYFFYIFFFEMAFFKLQADLVRCTPAHAMPLMASVQYAGVYLGMIVSIFLGSLLADAVGLFITSILFAIAYEWADRLIKTK